VTVFRDIGKVPSGIADKAAAGHLTKVTEAVQVLMGSVGDKDGLDRAIRFRDLLGDGLSAAQRNALGGVGGGGSGGTTIIIPGGSGSTDPTPDLTPPPTPSNLAVGAGLAYVYVTWDVASYTMGHGPGQTNIYAVTKEVGDPSLPTFGQAVQVAIAPHALTLIAIPSDPALRWHVWIKFQTVDGVESLVPAGGLHGVVASTGVDVAHLLQVLTGQITQSQLYVDLGTKINLITDPATTPGSVAFQILQETLARGTAIANEATLRQSADSALASTISSVSAATSAAAAAIVTEQTARVDGDTAQSNRTDVLFATSTAGALNKDPNCTSFTEFWQGDAPVRIAGSSQGRFAFQRTGSRAILTERTWIPVLSTKTYRARIRAQRSAGSDGLLYMIVDFRNSAGARVATAQGGSFSYYPVAGSNPGTTWTDYAVLFGNGQTVPIPAGAVEMTVGVMLQFGATTGSMTAEQIRLEDADLAKTAADITAAITTEQTARVSGDTALASQITTLAATVGSNTAAIVAEATARADGDSASADAITTVQSHIDTLGANLLINSSFERDSAADGLADSWVLYAASTTADAPLLSAGRISGSAQHLSTTSLGTTNSQRLGIYQRVDITPGSAAFMTATAYAKGTAGSKFYIYVETYLGSTLLSNQLGTAMTLGTTFGRAAITFAVPPTAATIYVYLWQSTRLGSAGPTTVDIDDAMLEPGQQVNSYISGPAELRSMSASVQQEISTRVTQTGQLFAQWTVKLDVNGYVSGFGLASTSSGATPFSSFIIRADSFAIAAPSGPGITPAVPFIVRTTPGTINGVSYPTGVYIDAAYILDLTTPIARMGAAWIDNAMVANLSAAKLTVGDGTIGGNLKSTNYVGGTSGWILRPDGYFEATNAILRGSVYAGAGSIGGVLIASGGIQSSNWVSGVSGYRFDYLGDANFNSVSIRGDIKGGAFTGYAWPASGGTGFFLGPGGLLLGNFNDGRYFQVTAGGDVYASQFSIVGGVATFAGTISAANGTFSGTLTAGAVNAVTTVNITPGSLSGFYAADSNGGTVTTSPTTYITVGITVPSGATGVAIAGGFHLDTGTYIYADLLRNGSLIRRWFVNGSGVGSGGSGADSGFGTTTGTPGIMEANVAVSDTPSAGLNTYTLVSYGVGAEIRAIGLTFTLFTR